MNERIKLLKHQASVWCDKNIPEQFSEEINGYGKAWEDKFAQLIIRECISLADLPNNTTGQWDHLSPSEVIANYFGVES